MLRSLPNALTFSRILVIPLIIACFYIKTPFAHQLAAGLFLFASVTDFFDGYLARAWSVQSRLGRFLDPIADKLLVAAIIVMLIHTHGISGIQIFPAIAIICREILVSGLREFLAELNASMPVSKLGKLKTAVQMTALFLLLLGKEGSGLWIVDIAGILGLWAAAALTVISGYAYLKAGLSYMSVEE